MKALQRLLTRSFSGKALAVKRVTENQGKRTPGIDGQTWSTPAAKMAAVHQLRQHGYQAAPLRRLYIPKANGQQRPLGIPTMKDRAMQALYRLALDPIAETTADPHSYGFRTGRSTADAIQRCFELLNKPASAQWVLEGDIQGCFDHISHEWLLSHIPIERRILQQWLKAGYLEKQHLSATEAGTPQGGVISPVLANMTLDGLEETLTRGYTTRQKQEAKVHLVRYADDFIITASQRHILEDEVMPNVADFLAERGLTLSPQKTTITHISQGFDFLGQNVRKYKGKMLIKPAKANVARFLNKVRTTVHRNRQATPQQLLIHLNPLIRGWANYHRHVVSKTTFNRVDGYIFWLLWRWARRRHPGKTKGWIRRRYFTALGRRQWVFCDQQATIRGKSQTIQLFQAAKVPIRRHIKIRTAANPYDPTWELYFEQRLEKQMLDDLGHRPSFFTLWQEQQGICPLCQQLITKQTGWHSHHIIWRVFGGADTLDNRVLLHPNCHRQLHSRRLSVEKPRLATGV